MNTKLPKVDQWHDASTQLTEIKAKEMALRLEVVGSLPADDRKFSIVDGTCFSVTLPESWAIEDDAKNGLAKAIQAIVEGGAVSPVSYKPVLSVKDSKALPDWAKKKLDPFVTSKIGTPQITALKTKHIAR